MWLLVMFDLPTDSKPARRAYARFRKFLLADGFSQMQFSVYSRCTPSQENAEVHLARVEKNLPPDGEVRLLMITDKQFERMRVFWGKMPKPPEERPCQLTLF